MRIVQISDTHIAGGGGVTEHNVLRALDHVESVLRPDFVVHSGDVVLGDPDAEADRRHARELLRGRVDRVLPGNHDVGEAGRAWMDLAVTDARVAAFGEVWGSDRFREDLGHATVLGIDSELLGSGLDREAEQWEWLEATGRELAGRPTLLFLHKPIWPVAPLPDGRPRTVDVASGDRLRAALAPAALVAVGSGHLHRYLQRRQGATLEVWAPATGFLASSPDIPGALPRLGVVEYEVADSGAVTARHHEIPGVREVDETGIAEAAPMLAGIRARAGR